MDLNDLYVGPKLQIETKYAAVLTLIFVDMTYSASMVSTKVVRSRNFFSNVVVVSHFFLLIFLGIFFS